MKILVNNKELEFNQESSKNWSATYTLNELTLYFSFDENIFNNSFENEIKIDWKLIEKFVSHIFENIDLIQIQGSKVLQVLRFTTLFQDEQSTNNGYFEVDSFYLRDFVKNIIRNNINDDNDIKYNFIYDVDFFYEHIDTYLSQNHYSYTAKFSNHQGICIIGVSNDIWSYYKKDE